MPDRRLLSTDGYRMLFRQGNLDDGSPVDYGFGWHLEYNEGQLRIARHGGWGSGKTACRNMVSRYFDDRITVALFAQEHPDFGRRTKDNGRLRDVVCDEIHGYVRSQITRGSREVNDTKQTVLPAKMFHRERSQAMPRHRHARALTVMFCCLIRGSSPSFAVRSTCRHRKN